MGDALLKLSDQASCGLIFKEIGPLFGPLTQGTHSKCP